MNTVTSYAAKSLKKETLRGRKVNLAVGENKLQVKCGDKVPDGIYQISITTVSKQLIGSFVKTH